jgi:SAM-dependent methyltransferase
MTDTLGSLERGAVRLHRLRAIRRELVARIGTLKHAEGAPSVPPGAGPAVRDPDGFDWGAFATTTPFSVEWGADRGRCIDRYYIERFLETHRDDVHGSVLEVHDDDYTRAYGGSRVTHSDVVDIDPGNPRATVVADLRSATSIPDETYDCVVLTQTLHLVFDLRAVLRECARMLKPGGVLLATLPTASSVAPEYGPEGDHWRFTPAAAERLFREAFSGPVDVRAHGNVLVLTAFLYGLACHELTAEELDVNDPYFPLIVTVRAERSATSGRG